MNHIYGGAARHLSLLTLMVALGGCGKGTTTLKFASYSRAPLTAKLCLKRLRFKTGDSDTSTTNGNVDFSAGQITLTSTGTTIGDITLPAGTYKRVEFDMEKDCLNTGALNSVEGTTSASAAFTSDKTITIKFLGTFEATSSAKTLEMGVQNIATALNGLTGGSSADDVKTALEAVSGTL